MDTQGLVDDLRQRRAELTDVEVKAATGGCPSSLRETLSAFANRGGGTILLGLANRTFEAVPINADALRDAVAGMAANDLTPPLTPHIEIEVIDDGKRIVRVDVPELDPVEKPCYVTNQGRYSGAYVRNGEGDRRLTHYEIDRLLENRAQPEFDRQPVRATLNDLVPDLVDSYLTRVAEQRPRAFQGLDRLERMRRLGLVAIEEGHPRPTLAALLTLGTYPQEFFPQLFISVVALPTPRMGDPGPSGERFLDNLSCDGPIPEMVETAVASIRRNMTRAALIEGIGRTDRYEYPLEVVRELVLNAVLHRDYSPGALGTQIQIELYPDRLVVRSPGGFYGSVEPGTLGEPDVSSTRNSLLARILADIPSGEGSHMLVENRGSGIPTVLRTLNRAGMRPPDFDGNFRRVQVTVPRHALLTPEILNWIGSLGEPDLTEAQVQALAVLMTGTPVRNQTLRGWGLHAADATRALTDLVDRGLITKVGDRRGASYTLSDEISVQGDLLASMSGEDRRDRIVELVARHGELKITELQTMVRASRPTLVRDLNTLVTEGRVEATAPARSRHRAYRASPGEQLPLSQETTP